MRFLITFNHIDGEWDSLDPEDRERHGAWLRELMTALKTEQQTELVFFHPVTEAKSVRMYPDRSIEVADGPFRDSPEQPGGYYIVEADSMDEAIEWARRGRFMVGSNEVRQIATIEG